MEHPRITSYTISDFVHFQFSKELRLAPKFQRRAVWGEKAKSYLIDTILRSMPIPPIFIRLKVDPQRRKSIREVIDGQQRIRTVLDFVANKFPIMKVHNPDYAGQFYSDLTEEDQSSFLGYGFNVNLLQNVSDSEVLDIFARMNTYAISLNAQELRNANFFGAFKQSVYRIAHKYHTFWTVNSIFTDRSIARMKEAWFVSELMSTMLDGYTQTKQDDLKKLYDRFDDEFPEAERIEQEFDCVIDIIGEMFPDGLNRTPYRKKPLFFSLFCVIYDARYGLPGFEHPRVQFTSRQTRKIADEFGRFASIISQKEPPRDYAPFMDAAQRATANIERRQTRHEVMWDCLAASL